MNHPRVIIGHARHGLSGPHLDMPGGFAPLCLRVEGEALRIEIACPIAVVGRHSSADLRFAYPEISRRHCRFVFENGEWRVHDLRSLNGVFLNGRSIAEGTLVTGDRLQIGCVKLFVEAGSPRRLVTPSQERPTQMLERQSMGDR